MAKIKHGHRYTKEYESWCKMKSRCYNKNSIQYPHYGGRGITVCSQWLHSFSNFLNDIGYRPTSKHSLDRIDNNGNYEPSNCCWSTQKNQVRNRRNTLKVTFKNETKTVKEWSEVLGINYYTLRNRLFLQKMPTEKAFIPVAHK